jgi:aryl-alcohol dehydrogenase-like predicted oxidoreductase
MTAGNPGAANRLSGIGKFTYGTTRLGDETIAFANRVDIAREAMRAGVWFHTSHTYGNALQVLRAAFDEDRAHVPPAIFKIGWDSIDQVRDVIRQNIEPLGIDSMAIGQLCLGGQLAEQFRTGGACYGAFEKLKAEGLVGRFVLECWPWNSQVALQAIASGYADGLIDGYIFYFNPLQRFVSNELWDLLRERDLNVIAMRTVAGGPIHDLRDSGRAPAYLQERATQIAPLYERSGCKTWPEFCIRYVYGVPQVRSSVGATSRSENLRDFLHAVESVEPLPGQIHDEIQTLQRRWYDDHDRHAEPWSM